MNKGFRLIAGLLVLPTLTWASRYTLHHRISPSSSWSTRGVITLSEVSGGSPSYEDLTGKVRPWDALAGTQSDPMHLYQLALTPESAKTVDAGAPMTFARVVSSPLSLTAPFARWQTTLTSAANATSISASWIPIQRRASPFMLGHSRSSLR